MDNDTIPLAPSANPDADGTNQLTPESTVDDPDATIARSSVVASPLAMVTLGLEEASGDRADRRRPPPEIPGFEVIEEIGRGGMGVVYLARRTLLNRPCALKMILAAEHASPESGLRFLVEAEAVAKVHHPNVIQIYSIGTLGGFPYLELEYAEGGSLEKQLDGVPWTPRRAAELIEMVARAVAEAHRMGLVHRDLKPGNVLMMGDGTPKVADFGLAKGLGSGDGLTKTDSVLGSPSYMAPEQAEGHARDVGPPADVYSLGAIFYELLCGRPPFRAATALLTLEQVSKAEPVPAARLVPSTPRDLDTIALKCLEKGPDRRYPTAKELAEDLRRWLDREPILARPIGRPERLLRWCQRRPAMAAMAASLVMVAALGFAGVAWQWRLAVSARDEAVRSKEQADRLAGEKTVALAVARRQTYRTSIAAATSALQLDNAGPARVALGLAPEEYRNWEWRHLASELDNSRSSFRVPSLSFSDMAASPDGSRMAINSDPDRLLLLLIDPSSGRVVAELPSRPRVSPPAFTADGGRVVFASKGRGLTVADSASGRVLASMAAPEGVVNSFVLLGPKGLWVAGTAGGRLLVWDREAGAEVANWPVPGLPTDYGGLLVANPAGDLVAFGVGQGVRLVEVATGRLARLMDFPTIPKALAFSPDGRRVAAGADYPDSTVRLWKLASDAGPIVLAGHTNQIFAVAFSPDGTRLASASRDQTARVWDATTGEPLGTLKGHTGFVNGIRFDPTGTRLLTSSADRTLRLWDSASFRPIAVLRGFEEILLPPSYRADGEVIYSASRAGEVRTWDAASLERDGVLRGHTSFVYDVAFSPDGTKLASAAWDGTARTWDVATGRPIDVFRHGTNILISASFGTSGKRLAVVEREANRVVVWDVPRAARLFDVGVPLHENLAPHRATIDPTGTILAVGDDDGLVRLFDAASGKPTGTLRGHDGYVVDTAFRPDGRRLASAGQDKTARIWDPATGRPLAVLGGHPGLVYRLAYSADGRLLAASSETSVTLWEPESGKKLAVLPQAALAYGLAFSPDGTRLAVGCSDNSIRLWDVVTREQVAELRGHTSYVHAVAFSPDGTRLASASGDTTIRIWDSLPARERDRSPSK